jgi:translocation and assembly module TamB
MKLLRWLVLSINALAALLLIAIGAAAWLLASERGTQWLLAPFLNRAASVLAVGRIEGTLLDELTLGDVAIDVNGDRITIAQLRLKLDLGQILRRALVIEELHSTHIMYTRGAGARPVAAGTLKPLPVTIEMSRVVIDGVTIESDQDQLLFDATTFTAVFAANELVVEGIETGSQGVRLSGRGEVGVDGGTRLAAAIDWQLSREGEVLAGRLTLAGILPQLDVSHELLSPFDVTAAGKLWLEGTPRIDFVVRWRDVSIPGRGEFLSPSGEANLTGEINALRYSSNGAVNVYGHALRYDATGDVTGAVVAFDPLTVTGAGGALSAHGEVALDSLQWEMTISGRDLDPSAHDPSWPGRLNLDAQLRGRLQPALEIDAERLSIAGILREVPFAAVASGAFESPSRLRIDRLEVAAEGDTLEASGTVDQRFDLALTTEVGALEQWWPGIIGSVAADLRIGGTRQEPRISGRVTTRGIAYRGYEFGSAELNGAFAGDADGPIALGLVAENAVINGVKAESLRARVDGTVRAHSITIDVLAERWESAIAARGGVVGQQWHGNVESARVDQAALGEWRLLEPAGIEIGRSRAIVQTSCLSQAASDFCASMRITGRADDEIVLSARNFDLQTLQPIYPDMLDVQGIYQLAATVTDPIGEPRGRLALTGGPTRLHVALSDERDVESEIERVILGADFDGGRLDLRLDVDGGDTGRVNLRTTMADVSDRNSAVEGQLDVSWQDLGVLTLLTPDIGSVAGSVAMQLELGGTVGDPELAGRAQWNDGTVGIPVWGLVIERIESSAVTVDGNTLEYSGAGFVDDRELRVEGTTLLDSERNWLTRLSVNGESLQLVQLAEAEVFVSPDLDVEVALPDISVSGAVHVPRAVITLDAPPEQAQRPSADSVVHGVSEPVPVRALRTRADVRVTLGDDVHYNGSNLTTDVDGELQLRYASGRPSNASGALSLSGSYNAYGQALQLSRGELLFTGPLDDPAIDVRAERVIGETTVGVQLTGTLKAPITRIYSDPALSEADALAYLLLGRPLSGTGEQETATLETAALAMGLQQALPVVQRIGSSLGLDEFSIQTTDVDAGALMAGKYLSPRLFVRYSYGLFNRIGGLLVRFRVNERLSIETRSGDEKSMDLLYTVEKD